VPARKRGLVDALPTDELELHRLPKSNGYLTATEADVKKFQDAHKVGSQECMALEMFLNFGARGQSDARLFGPRNLWGGEFVFTANKNKRRVALPILEPFKTCLPHVPAGQETFLLGETGKPMARTTFGPFFHDALVKAGLPVGYDEKLPGGRRVRHKGLSAHSFRKCCAVRLRHAGVSIEDIAAVFGDSVPMVKIYIAAADHKIAVERAFAQLQAAAAKKGTGFG
jgi:hypothetical protein